MRLFLFNHGVAFSLDDISTRTQVKKPEARKELALLSKIGMIKKKDLIVVTEKKPRSKKSKPKVTKKKVSGFVINSRFELIRPLEALLLEYEFINDKEIVKRLKKSGSIKLLVLSGIFVRDDNRDLDMLVVGDKIKRPVLEKELRLIESEIGKELRYAIFDTKEFQYRISMYDKLVRDILEHEHRKLISTLID